MSAKAAKHARELLLKEYRGMLATHSKKMPGFPFGSVVPYCLDADGRPLLLISRIAQHTHNLQADGRCSLLIGERDAEDIQAAGRLIRSETDSGVIALFDKRFLDRPYRDRLPADWLTPDDEPAALAGDPAAVARRFFGRG